MILQWESIHNDPWVFLFKALNTLILSLFVLLLSRLFIAFTMCLLLSLCVYSFHYEFYCFHYVFIAFTMCLKSSLWITCFSYYIIYVNYVVV